MWEIRQEAYTTYGFENMAWDELFLIEYNIEESIHDKIEDMGLDTFFLQRSYMIKMFADVARATTEEIIQAERWSKRWIAPASSPPAF